MGNATSLPLLKNLRKASEKDGWISHVPDFLKREKCSDGESSNKEDLLNGTVPKEIVIDRNGRDIEIYEQKQLLQELLLITYSKKYNPESYVDSILKTAKDLQKKGFAIDDKWLARLMLYNLPKEFDSMAKEMRRKSMLKSKVIAEKIIEVARQKFYCEKCEMYAEELNCWCYASTIKWTKRYEG